MAEQQAPKRGKEHEALAVFLGKWHAEGESYARGQSRDNPRGVVERWVSDETDDWLPGQFFIVKRWDAMIGAHAFQGLGIIGHAAGTDHYVMRSFENHGFYREYETRVDGNVWTFSGHLERARVEFTESGNTQVISWEWNPDGKGWLPLCDRTARRVS